LSALKKYALRKMVYNKKVSEPNFIIYNEADMPNKYLRKYYGLFPVLAYTIKTDGEELRLKGFCDNFIYDDYTPLSQRKNKEKTSTEE